MARIPALHHQSMSTSAASSARKHASIAANTIREIGSTYRSSMSLAATCAFRGTQRTPPLDGADENCRTRMPSWTRTPVRPREAAVSTATVLTLPDRGPLQGMTIRDLESELLGLA